MTTRIARLLLLGLAVAATLASLALFAFPSSFNFARTFSITGACIALAWLAALFFGAVYILKAGRPLLFLVVVLLSTRIATFLLFQPAVHPPNTDPGHYLEMAENILRGDGIHAGRYYATWPPLYPIFLSAVGSIFGLSFGVTLLNAALDAGSAATITRIDQTRAGWAAAYLYLLWPTVVLGASVPQKESLAICLALQLTLAFLRLRDQISYGEILRLGVTAALLGLTQPALATFVICVALVFSPTLGLKRLAHIAALSAPIAILILLPWWIRNWHLFHQFVPLTIGSGYSMLVAVTGRYEALDSYWAMSEAAGSKAAAKAAMDLLLSQPLDAIQHRFTSMAQAMAIEDFAVARMPWMGFPTSVLGLLIPSTQAAFGAALWTSSRSVRGDLALLFFACLLQFFVFNIFFEFAERHRYVLTPFLLLAAAAWLAERTLRAPRPGKTDPGRAWHGTLMP